MKRMKAKLMASLAMLVVAAIMVTSTSYAWYTINTYATISSLNITLAQTQNVEVAKAYMVDDTHVKMVKEVTDNDTTDLQNTFGGAVEYKTGEIKLQLPAEKVLEGKQKVDTKETAIYYRWDDEYVTDEMVAADSTKYPKAVDNRVNISWADDTDHSAGMVGVVYDTDGRTMGFRNATQVTDQKTGLSTYTYKYEKDSATSKSATIALSYNMFVRTNTAGDIVIDYETAGTAKGAKISFTVYDMSQVKFYSDNTKVGATKEDVASTSKSANLKVVEDDPNTKEVDESKNSETTTAIDYYYKAAVAASGDTPATPAYYVAKLPSATEKLTATGTGNAQQFTAKANEVYLVQVFAYIDGDEVIAEDFVGSDFVATLQNIKFTNSAINKDAQDWENENMTASIALNDAKTVISGVEAGYFYKTASMAKAVEIKADTTSIAGISATYDVDKKTLTFTAPEEKDLTVEISYTVGTGTTAKTYKKSFTIPKKKS